MNQENRIPRPDVLHIRRTHIQNEEILIIDSKQHAVVFEYKMEQVLKKTF